MAEGETSGPKAAEPRGTRVDLSCNLLTSLPDDFCSLRYLVRLDLSKNQLQSLPKNLGDLQKLQHLDLFSNKLTALPVSTFQLKALKWLDVRENPLDENLMRVAGNCLNEAECKQCAQAMVAYMRQVQGEMERRKQKRLEQDRVALATRKIEEEEERQRMKADKLAEKERRRVEYKAKQAKLELNTTPMPADDGRPQTDSPVSNGTSVQPMQKENNGLSCCGAFLVSFLGLLVLMSVGYYYCNTHPKDEFCRDIRKIMMPYWTSATQLVNKYIKS